MNDEGSNIPSTAPAGFWKPDIDRMGSDLAHRPSENAPTNCDSSSEKSNDSPRMSGVWKSGSNWNQWEKETSQRRSWAQGEKPRESEGGVCVRGRAGFKQEGRWGLEERSKTCGHPEEEQKTGILTKTPCVFE